jgi:hypothetical protein
MGALAMKGKVRLNHKQCLRICLDLISDLEPEQYNYRETATNINEDFLDNLTPSQFQIYIMGKAIERARISGNKVAFVSDKETEV